MIKDKIVIVTGASRGIGIEISVSLIKQGATVILASRDIDLIEERVAGLEGSYLIHKTDVADENSIKLLVDTVIAKYGHIDVLINNAGFVEPKSLFETTIDNWNKTLAVNLTGVFLTTKEVSRYMKKTGGKIINIASTAGLSPRPGWSAYAASKAGLINFSETMAEELREYNIKVFIIAPGRTATDLRRRLAPNEDPKTIMQPDKIANIVNFMLSDNADVIEGQVVLVREKK
jgi:3-oxoacyl-[acyl-carrier protein] reductase